MEGWGVIDSLFKGLMSMQYEKCFNDFFFFSFFFYLYFFLKGIHHDNVDEKECAKIIQIVNNFIIGDNQLKKEQNEGLVPIQNKGYCLYN